MRILAPLIVAFFPSTSLAEIFDCTLITHCSSGVCEPYPGGPALIENAGELWRFTVDGQSFEGQAADSRASGGEISIFVHPKTGGSGLISIYPSGEVMITAHNFGNTPIAITSFGNCAGEGG